MPRSIMLAYDHRSEEGINLIRQYVEDYAAAHDGVYPLPADVRADGAVGLEPQRRYWPSNPWDHFVMVQRGDRGSFAYAVAPDRSSYTLRLHRALKGDYVLTGAIVTSPWQQLLASLEDEILRRSGRILKGYVDQWALQHAGALPQVDGHGADRGRRRGAPRLAAGPEQRRRDAARHRPGRLHLRARRRRRLHPHRPSPLRRLRGRRHRAVACGAGARLRPPGALIPQGGTP